MENKTSKYFKYAIGEIVLVVIGILIALSINNWNEQRKVSLQEQSYLKALKEEFQYNKTQLEEVVSKNEVFGNAAFELLKHTGPNPPAISEQEVSNLFLTMLNSEVQY